MVVQAIGPLNPDDPATLPETHERIFFCHPDSAKPSATERAECAKKIIQRFASRAYRRPVTGEELDHLMRFWHAADDDGQPLEGRMKAALTAVLVSPNFLFRVELDPPANEKPSSDLTGKHPITDYELASRLSYFLWSSMPDDELFRECLHGTLRKEGNLETQVHRMLKDPKRSRSSTISPANGSKRGGWRSSHPIAASIPISMKSCAPRGSRETELFFSHVMTEDRSVLDFLSADYTWANERLAKHYGISDVHGPEFRRRVARRHASRRSADAGKRAHAHLEPGPHESGEARQMGDGEFARHSPPPPKANVPAARRSQGRAQRHRAATAGATSGRSDLRRLPQGDGPWASHWENFDPVGGRRTKDGTFPIESTGTLPGGKTFQGVDGLRGILLARKDQFCRCLAEKMLTYALGRGLEDYDDAAIDQVADAAPRIIIGFRAW